MKTVFLLNPKAGKGRGLDKIKEAVARASQELNTEAGAYLTKSVGDAEKFARLPLWRLKLKERKSGS